MKQLDWHTLTFYQPYGHAHTAQNALALHNQGGVLSRFMLAIVLLLSVFSALLSNPAQAEIKQTLGSWDVHYIAFSSTFLTPEIARANNLVRSKFNAVINISVLDKETKKAQRVAVTGTARNLLGTAKTFEFKRVEDGEAIYYLAPLS